MALCKHCRFEDGSIKPNMKLLNFNKSTSHVEFSGEVGEVRLRAYDERRNTLLVTRKGYSENPGSRYSGLKSYYPAEHFVLKLLGNHEFINGTSEDVFDAEIILNTEGRL